MNTRTRTGYLVYPKTTLSFRRSIHGVDDVGDNFPNRFDVQFPQSIAFTRTFEVASALPSKGHGTFKSWNNFEHYARSCEPESRPYRWATQRYTNFAPDQAHVTVTSWPGSGWSFSCPYGSWDSPYNGLPSLYLPTSSGFTHIESNETVLRDEAFKSLLPGIRPRLSLLNSIYELKDYKTLLHTARRIKDYQNYWKQLNLRGPLKSLAPKGRRTLRKVLGLVSDVYLQTQFNILPLLADIEACHKSLISFNTLVNRLLEDEGRRKLQRLQWSLKNTYSDENQEDILRGYGTAGSSSPGPDESVGLNKAYRFVRYPEAVFNAQMEYSYTLDGYPKEFLRISGLLDSLGVNFNPVIIWNAIPWSFVVDWIIGVNRFLDQFESRNIKPKTTIHRWCWSYSVVRNITLLKDVNVATYWTALSVPVAKHTESAYKRSNSTPSLITAITGSGLSLKEFSLGAALGGSRL